MILMVQDAESGRVACGEVSLLSSCGRMSVLSVLITLACDCHRRALRPQGLPARTASRLPFGRVATGHGGSTASALLGDVLDGA